MFAVIFRAKMRAPDDEYSRVAARLRKLAMESFHCLEFVSVCEGDEEISISYWPDEASIQAWKAEADHVLAQELGRQQWYERYRVQVAEIRRDYDFPPAG